MMDAEKQAMQRRIDTLDQHAVKLHAALIEAERENAQLKAELESVKRERDALKDSFLSLACEGFSSCYFCAHFKPDEAPCKHTLEIGAEDIGDCFEWRGVQENGGAEDA